MKAQRCSWVDLLKWKPALCNGERGDQKRAQQLTCISKGTVSAWKSSLELVEATDGKVCLTKLSECQPTHAAHIARAIRKCEGKKPVSEWSDESKDKALEWVERVEAEKLTVSQLKELLKAKPEEPESEKEKTPAEPLQKSLNDLITKGKKFGCIYADPPWQYGNQATRASTDNHYSTMTIDAICELPISQLAADNAHLHLWTTNGFLFECQRLMEKWGFEYKSCFVWVKPQFGIGNYWRVAHEFMLLGVRGSLPFKDKGLRSWEQYDRTAHSAKPPEVRSLIEKASPGPYLELFGRRRVKGWTVWGNQDQGEEFRQEAFAS